MKTLKTRLAATFAAAAVLAVPTATAGADALEKTFDTVIGGAKSAPVTAAPRTNPLVARTAPTSSAAITRVSVAPTVFADPLYKLLASVAGPDRGRIGVAAMDLATGRTVGMLDSQPFPMASTSKVAIVATFLQGVDQGRWGLDDRFPMMMPIPSAKLSSAVAPVRAGPMLSARQLIDLALIHSNNQATDGLLAAVGGPAAVNRWVAGTGLTGFNLQRDIATLVRDDGLVDPATRVDTRDSVNPQTMVRLLAGLRKGQWLSDSSRAVLFSAMERCVTGKRRLKALMPAGASVAHKTGTLNNTSSDVGFIRTPDGREYAVAVYVTGQGSKPARDERIATIARTLYDGFEAESRGLLKGTQTASR